MGLPGLLANVPTSRREHPHVGPLRLRKPGVALTVWPREDRRALRSLRHHNQSWAPLAIVFRSDLQIAPPLDGTEPFPPKGVGEGLLRPDPERGLVEGQVDVPTSLYRRDGACDVEG